MLGNVGRHRRWPWVILFFLFALTFAWSFGVMGEEVGDVWSILRIGSAAGSALSLLLLVLASISNRRHRRAERDQGSEAGADEEEQEEQPPTVPTYEEVFGLELDLDEGSLPRAPEDVEWTGDDEAELEAEAQPWAEQLSAEEGAPSDEDGRVLDADLEEVVDQVDQVDALADGDPQEQLRRMREEFKARAEEAALRVKQREAELHEATSAPDSQR
jgi:hypothetical protein